MEKFKKLTAILRSIVIGYMFYTFPLTLIGIFIIPDFSSPAQYNDISNKTIFITSASQIVIWTLISLFYSITMFFSRINREALLKKISGIRERDEREVKIGGKALRASYLSTMTILLFLMFISLFHIELSMKSTDNTEPVNHSGNLSFNVYHAEPGKPRGSLSINIGLDLFDQDSIATQKKGFNKYYKFDGIPVSTSGLILILLIWQTASYRYVLKKSLKLDN